MPESPGVDILIEPTENQYASLKNYINYFINKKGCFYIDLPQNKFLEYEGYFYTSAIILEDIKKYFKNFKNGKSF